MHQLDELDGENTVGDLLEALERLNAAALFLRTPAPRVLLIPRRNPDRPRTGDTADTGTWRFP